MNLEDLTRKEVRRIIFSIRDDFPEMRRPREQACASELYTVVDKQLDRLGFPWSRFTFDWDVHPKLKLKVIARSTWDAIVSDWHHVHGKHLHPAGCFTEQEPWR